MDHDLRRWMRLVETAVAAKPDHNAVCHISELNDEQQQQAMERFNALADGQRKGPPERLGGASMGNRGIHVSGLYAGLTEHVGDITNRMAKRWDFYQGSFENCRDKVDMGLRRVDDLGREINRQVAANYAFQSHPDRASEHAENPRWTPRYEGTLTDWRTWWREAGSRYADAHAALTVWNDAQFHAREAAVACGRLNWLAAREHLRALKQHLGSPEEWIAFAGQVRLGPDGTILPR